MKKLKLLPISMVALFALAGCNNSYTPPNYKEADYKYLFGTFEGLEGSLEIGAKETRVTFGNEVLSLLPTKIKSEVLYQGDVEIQSIYYGKQRNKEEYRVTLNNRESRQVILQKKTDAGYALVANYVPESKVFAGSYNGYDEFDLDQTNYVYSVGNELNKYKSGVYPGYDVGVYYFGDYMESELLFVPGLLIYDGEALLSGDFFDMGDGEFFDLSLVPYSSGDLYVYYEDLLYPYLYADPSMFVMTDIYDENGASFTNSYSYDGETATITVDDKEATMEKGRNNEGQYFKFNNGTNEFIVTARYDGFTYQSDKDPDATHYYASYTTSLSPAYYTELVFKNGDFSNSFEYYYDIDWDTWEDIFVCKYNDADITITYSADMDGRLKHNFTYQGDNYYFKKININLLTLASGSDVEYLFNYTHYDSVFNNSFFSTSIGILSINDFEAEFIDPSTLDSSDPIKCKLDYSSEYDAVVLDIAGNKLIPTPIHEDLFIYETDITSYFMINENLLFELNGKYTSNGTDLLEYNDYALSLNGEDIPYEFTVVSADSDYAIALSTKDNLYLPNYNGIIDAYSNSGLFVATYINEDAFNSLVGVYSLEGQYGVEHVEFDADGKFYMDTPEGETLVKKQYNYRFSSDDNGVLTLNAIYTTPQGNVYVPFVKANYALVIPAANLFYVDDRIFDLRGAWGDGSENTMFISQTVVTVNNTSYKINNITVEQNRDSYSKTVIINASSFSGMVTITAYYQGDEIAKMESLIAGGDSVIYSERNMDLLKYEGKQFAATSGNVYTASAIYSSVNNAISIQVNKNGSFFASTMVAVYHEGHLALKASAPFGSAILTYDESGNPIAIE